MTDLPSAPYVLLVNAREEKGFSLIVSVAAQCLEIPFVVIASQSDVDAAANYAKSRNAPNITVLPRTDDMGRLYDAAKVVAVPSYKFVETFSRVCIEAHRFNKPVLGSDVGNVPNLLEHSGIVLPEDVAAWAYELRRLFTDDNYYAQRQNAATTNSALYSYTGQRAAIFGVISALSHPILVAVGSGIGNMLHVTPMIRLLSKTLDQRVDIVVAEDHSSSLFLLHNDFYVNSVFSLRQIVLNRSYEKVFITHSFGKSDVQFRGLQVVESRSWDLFSPNHQLHEAHFNLEAARKLLGIEYSKDDILGYYVGNLRYNWPNGDLVGFHGGSKEGFWASKRWPFFSDLAKELTKRGLRVASFGTVGEYVDGTIDFTGGSIKEMALKMRECSYFVSNDSGVMNIANSLGIPLIAIFGPTEARTRGPLRPTSQWVELEKTCAPCEWKADKVFKSGNCRCIHEIPLSKVLEAFDVMVNANKESATEIRIRSGKPGTNTRSI